MTAIPYQQAREWPPFPALSVSVSNLMAERAESVSAKIDTGAFMTVMPRRLLERIQADETPRERECMSYGGHSNVWPVFIVGLEVLDPRWPDHVERRFEAIDVLGVDGPAEVLLGRDVLAAWHLHLDGPNNRYTVT